MFSIRVLTINTGSTYRVEAHVQHEISNSEAENNDAAMRFGNLTLGKPL